MRLMAAEVQVDVNGGVMVVTVNRPQARNAITRPVAEAIAAAFDALDASGELMAGVLTGAGGEDGTAHRGIARPLPPGRHGCCGGREGGRSVEDR